MSTEQIVFGPFRFDPVTLQLWKNEQVVAVQPKPLAVLRSLVVWSGQVVTKKELLKEVWVGTYEAELYRLKGELTLQKFRVSS